MAVELRGLAGKKVTAIMSQGGSYKPGSPREGWDFGSGYLELVFTALGSTDVEVIVSEFDSPVLHRAWRTSLTAKKPSIAEAKNVARVRAAA